MSTLTVRISDKLHNDLKMLAGVLHKGEMNTCYEKALREYVKNHIKEVAAHIDAIDSPDVRTSKRKV